MSIDTDEELVRRFLAGDRPAFATLVERHQRRVYNLAYRMVGRPEDAADVTQDVFVTCLRKLSGFRGTSSFTTWLHRVAVNACYDTLRRRGREQPVAENPEPAPAPDPADAAAAAVDVQRALLEVPEEYRAVLILHDVQGIPYEEVAHTIGAPIGTVKSRLHRGRIALARALRGEQPGPAPASNLGEMRR
ncbi:MAG: RNA polymerase sigma factor [Actinomycetota bacterium]